MSTAAPGKVDTSGWRHGRDDKGHYYQKDGTQTRTPSFGAPGPALEAARALQRAMDSGQLEAAPPAPDVDVVVGRLEYADTLPELYHALAEFGLFGLADAREDARFADAEFERVNEALTACEERLCDSGVEPDTLSRLYEISLALAELNGDGGEDAEEVTRLTAERARLLGLNDGLDSEDPSEAEGVASSSPSDETEKEATEQGAASGETKAAAALLDPAIIRTDGGTQARAALDERTVAEYSEQMLAGEVFPPAVVFYDGADYWLADGFHRHAATLRAEVAEIAADVRQGTRRDAVLYALGANARHGLRRTDADKRRAVETMLRDAEWSMWSNREIARQCGVSKGFVGDVRASLTGARAPEEVKAVRGGREYTVNTSNLGARKSDDEGVLLPEVAAVPFEERSRAFDRFVDAHKNAPAEATPSGAPQPSAPETEAAPTPPVRDEAGRAETHPAEASAGAPDFTVTDRRRIKPEDAEATPAAAHVAARPDRWAEVVKRLDGRALVVSHTLFSRGVSGVMVTVNLTGKDPGDALNSKLFPVDKVMRLGEAEYELVCQRLDAEKSNPKPKAAAKKPATKKASARKAAAPAKTGGPKNGMLVTVRRTKGAFNPARKFQIGDVVLITDREAVNAGLRGEVTGYYTVNKDKFQVKVGGKYSTYLASQLKAEKKTATRGATKKPAKKGGR